MNLRQTDDHFVQSVAQPMACGALTTFEQASLRAREVLAINIRLARKLRNWSQEALALEAGLDRTFVAHVERSARNISIDNIERLACALQYPLCALLNEEFERLAGTG